MGLLLFMPNNLHINVARFKLVMAERAINHLNKLIRMKTITSYVPLVYEERTY